MHIRNVDLNLLVTFDAVYRHGNVTRAASELGLTQPAVSHAVRRLRAVYGDPLFVRTRGGLRPTLRADSIAPAVKNALQGIDRTLEWQFDPASLNRAFRFGLVGYTAFFLLPVLLERIQIMAPQVSVKVDPIDGAKVGRLVSRNEVDFAIGLVGGPVKGCIVQALFTDEYRYIARQGHPLMSGGIDVGDLSAMRHVSIPLLYNAQARLSAAVPVTFGLTTNNLLSVPFIVSNSDLVAVLPKSVATIFKDYCNLQVLEPPIDLGTYSIGLVSNAKLDKESAYSWMKQVVIDSSRGVSQMLDLSTDANF